MSFDVTAIPATISIKAMGTRFTYVPRSNICSLEKSISRNNHHFFNHKKLTTSNVRFLGHRQQKIRFAATLQLCEATKGDPLLCHADQTPINTSHLEKKSSKEIYFKFGIWFKFNSKNYLYPMVVCVCHYDLAQCANTKSMRSIEFPRVRSRVADSFENTLKKLKE